MGMAYAVISTGFGAAILEKLDSVSDQPRSGSALSLGRVCDGRGRGGVVPRAPADPLCGGSAIRRQRCDDSVSRSSPCDATSGHRRSFPANRVSSAGGTLAAPRSALLSDTSTAPERPPKPDPCEEAVLLQDAFLTNRSPPRQTEVPRSVRTLQLPPIRDSYFHKAL
ncbi:hypothetical protein GN956_G5864 [Arapaima gigas]